MVKIFSSSQLLIKFKSFHFARIFFISKCIILFVSASNVFLNILFHLESHFHLMETLRMHLDTLSVLRNFHKMFFSFIEGQWLVAFFRQINEFWQWIINSQFRNWKSYQHKPPSLGVSSKWCTENTIRGKILKYFILMISMKCMQ